MSNSVRLVALNLQHSARPKEVPAEVVAVASALRADVAVFTEWVRHDTTSAFLDGLAKIGLVHRAESDNVVAGDERENHVLVVSRWAMTPGDLPRAPRAAPNALSVGVPGLDLELLALRIPSYGSPIKAKQKTVEERLLLRKESLRAQERWMDWLLAAGRARQSGRSVMIGDFNSQIDDREKWRCADRLRSLRDEGWVHAVPAEGCSYSTTGGRERKLDYAFVSPSLSVISAEYHRQAGGHLIAGRKRLDGAITDHAAFVVTIGL